METRHRIIIDNAAAMARLDADSVNLVVTSPPYPMIEMWDPLFSAQSQRVRAALDRKDGPAAFEAMHALLDPIWHQIFRVLAPGGFACINIGDAVRTLQDRFSLYPNHARIIQTLLKAGFSLIPAIIWRKQTNAPNKFMGSGMLPAGAYVTLEHEMILVARKGGRRMFKTRTEKENRRASALFWEERNCWFSDVWTDLKGTRQALGNARGRKRSAAFPFELAYRLICMYSVKGDWVLDPFLGTGTTTQAAMAAARNSRGFELDPDLWDDAALPGLVPFFQNRIRDRLSDHQTFICRRTVQQKPVKHRNTPHGVRVVTAQEKDLTLDLPVRLTMTEPGKFKVSYRPEKLRG